MGLDVVRQNRDRDARMLNDAPPDLPAFGRRLMADAAAALPAMVAAASAVAQPELRGWRHASSPSPVADFPSVAVSPPDSDGKANRVVGSCIACVDDDGS